MEIRRNKIDIANAKIVFKNFSGMEKRKDGRVVNDAGNRNFNVILDPEQSQIWWNDQEVTNPDFGQELAANGFRVSIKPGDEERPTEYRLPVAVSFKSAIKPKLYLVTARGKVELDEDSINELDFADIVKADIVINSGRPYIDNRGEEKVKAWCNEAYFTISESRFADEYSFEQQ